MSVFKFQTYDLVVCGAGPAGLMTAYTFAKKAENAKKVLLLDKKEPWKEPIFCAEAVSADRLSKLWPIDRSWVRGDISGIYFTSPKRYRAEFYSKNCGMILDRPKFHHSIADSCVNAGAECHFDTVVKAISHNADGTWNLNVQPKGGEPETICAKAIVDATGPGSRLTCGVECLEGIESGDTDLEPAIFAVAEGIEHSREHIELFFGSDFPDGYGWIFPRDGKEVNIGFVLGKDADRSESLRKMLFDFIAKDYPQAKVKAVYGGMIACGQSERPMAKCGLFKALDAGTEAERASVERSVLGRWMKALGKSHLQLQRAKKGFNSISDAQFDRAAKSLSKLPREKQTLFRIFFSVLCASPSLIWKMRSFIR